MKSLMAVLLFAASVPAFSAPLGVVKALHCQGLSKENDFISLDVGLLSEGARLTKIVALDAKGKVDADVVKYLRQSYHRETYGPQESGVPALPLSYQGILSATGYGDGQWILNLSADHQRAQFTYDDDDGAIVTYDLSCR